MNHSIIEVNTQRKHAMYTLRVFSAWRGNPVICGYLNESGGHKTKWNKQTQKDKTGPGIEVLLILALGSLGQDDLKFMASLSLQ
jgi:hypothetical protein